MPRAPALHALFAQLRETQQIKSSPCSCHPLTYGCEVSNKQAVREAATICPAPCKLTFDLLTLKVVSESRVTWATSVPILVFPVLSVLDLGPMYATDRRQTRIIA